MTSIGPFKGISLQKNPKTGLKMAKQKALLL
jgi:hypothetical protein